MQSEQGARSNWPAPDLYLTCAKFVTTPEYVPRLRARLEVEQQLVQDADEHGWTREVERHTAIAGRPRGLLTDLDQADAPSCHPLPPSCG